MNRVTKQRLSARRKLRTRALLSVLVSGLVVSATLYPSVWWLALWIPALLFFNWREWLVFALRGFFQCSLCRKLKERKHRTPVGSAAVPDGGDYLVCCDACAAELKANLDLLKEAKARVRDHVSPPPSPYRCSVPSQGEHRFGRPPLVPSAH